MGADRGLDREARRANAGTSRVEWKKGVNDERLLGAQSPDVEGGDLVRVSGREAGMGEDGG